MATKVCLICARDRDESNYEKAPGKETRKDVCVTCTENLKIRRAPSP
jgi:hypothetical protein